MIPLMTPTQLFLTVRILPYPFHLLLCILYCIPRWISSLPIAINVSLNSNIMTHNPTTYSPSTPILSSILSSRSFQTHPSILLTPISNPYNTSLYSPFSSNSFSLTGPSVFPGSSSIFPCLRSSFAITGSIPSPSLSSTVTPCTLPTSFSSSSLQPDFGLHPSRRLFMVPRATLPGRRRAPRAEKTSYFHCQLSDISHSQLLLAWFSTQQSLSWRSFY